MSTHRAKLLLVAVVAMLLGFALFLLMPRQPRHGPKQWLVISAPVFGSRMTPTGVVQTVTMVISNMGPRTIDPSLSWFECRAKTGLVRMEENEGWRPFGSLAPGKALPVSCDLAQSFSLMEVPLFCCEITWFERGSFARRQAQALALSDNPNIKPWNVDWLRPWQFKPLTNGVAFASNLPVPDYFRLVYGIDEAYFDRTLRQMKASSTTNRNSVGRRYAPTRDQQITNSSWEHYVAFCQFM